MKKILILLVLLLVVSCGKVDSPDTEAEKEIVEPEIIITYIELTPAEAKEAIEANPDVIVLDVSPNYDEGHIPGAINYYVGDGSLDEAIPTLEKNIPYLVYCHVDSAAILGAQKLLDANFTTIYRLKGNYKAWVKAGYPVEK
ncbi:rhodanese-like domain-containing protein [Nanoarchaeota archaeon]